MKYLYWALLWLPVFIIGQMFRFLSPIACLFVKRTVYTTTVKRYGRQERTLQRDRLVWWLSWLDTHDNATDEWWYGVYNVDSFGFAQLWSQADYDNSRFIRWFCRMMWLQRNSAYGFNIRFFSKPVQKIDNVIEFGDEATSKWFFLQVRKDSFQLEVHHPLWAGKFNSINIGWKEHEGQNRLLYAGRVLGIRSI